MYGHDSSDDDTGGTGKYPASPPAIRNLVKPYVFNDVDDDEPPGDKNTGAIQTRRDNSNGDGDNDDDDRDGYDQDLEIAHRNFQEGYADGWAGAAYDRGYRSGYDGIHRRIQGATDDGASRANEDRDLPPGEEDDADDAEEDDAEDDDADEKDDGGGDAPANDDDDDGPRHDDDAETHGDDRDDRSCDDGYDDDHDHGDDGRGYESHDENVNYEDDYYESDNCCYETESDDYDGDYSDGRDDD